MCVRVCAGLKELKVVVLVFFLILYLVVVFTVAPLIARSL